MKTSPSLRVLPAAACLAVSASAGVIHTHQTVLLAVPDASASGLATQVNVPAGLTPIADVNVTLTLSGAVPAGGWSGDLYAWLGHAGARSVLLNRPGRTATNGLGYDDDGLLGVTFDDAAPNGDVHLYQATLGFAPGQLGGLWQPDGRDTDPAVDTDARTLPLSVFNGLPAGGDWTLFVADLSGGGGMTLVSWELEITTVVIPEPGSMAAVLGALSLGWVTRRRLRRRAGE